MKRVNTLNKNSSSGSGAKKTASEPNPATAMEVESEAIDLLEFDALCQHYFIT
jgi:hypothetical protein